MSGGESGDLRKSETPQGGVGAQMPREGSIPSAALRKPTTQQGGIFVLFVDMALAFSLSRLFA